MRGTRLASLARRLLHEDTFDLVVSPAIADLQFEERGYAGVWVALAGACARDVGGDLRLLLDDAGMFAALIGIEAGYFAGMLTLMGSLTAGVAPHILLAVVALCGVGTLACFWPEKRRT